MISRRNSSCKLRKKGVYSHIFGREMETTEKLALLEAFEELSDPRGRECPHKLEELLLVAICAVISGAEGWESMSQWGKLKLYWLQQYLPFAS